MPGFISDRDPRSNAQLIQRISLHYGDITKQGDCEAIVTAIGQDMKIQGSLNSAIIKAAGEKLDEFILEHIYKPRSGDVVAVPPFNLRNKYIFFAITPRWDDTLGHEERDLMRCYRHSVQLAQRMQIRRIAFPALGMNGKTFPTARAARLAITGIMDRMTRDIEEVRIVCNRDAHITVFYERLQKMGWRGKVMYDE